MSLLKNPQKASKYRAYRLPKSPLAELSLWENSEIAPVRTGYDGIRREHFQGGLLT